MCAGDHAKFQAAQEAAAIQPAPNSDRPQRLQQAQPAYAAWPGPPAGAHLLVVQ